jgi:anti-anti-sigma factor
VNRTRREARRGCEVRAATTQGFGGLLVLVEGELDISIAEQLAAPTEVAIRAGCPLVLDLSECSFMDVSALRAVLRIHHLTGVGKGMAVVSGQSQVRKMLSMTAMELCLHVFKTRGEAIAWFAAEGAIAPNLEVSLIPEAQPTSTAAPT